MADLAFAAQRIQNLTRLDLANKSIFELFASDAEELGELSRELLIEERTYGNAHKLPDEGSKAEAVDLLICAAALFFGRGGSVEVLAETLHRKLDKWERKHQSSDLRELDPNH